VTRRLLDTLASRLPDGTAPDPRVALLTERELEVLRAVARGQSNAEIPAALVLSELTVKTHVARILGKLGVRDRTQAAVFAHTHGPA
jgi:DNA-binding NarL/FixJ family response regulator